MSTAREPFKSSDGAWCWSLPAYAHLGKRPSDLPHDVFRELLGGEFCEPEDSTDRLYYYPTRAAALAALADAERRARTTTGGK